LGRIQTKFIQEEKRKEKDKGKASEGLRRRRSGSFDAGGR
jgi:hypothetical protein